jgi:hypothetical protein
MELAYAAIGRAVFAAQLFEVALTPIFEGFKMIVDPAYREKTGGYIPAGAFKVPITSIVKTLVATGDIAPDLEARLVAYAEDRHTLIHRWIINNGWPDDTDAEGFRPIVELANRVEHEAKLLTRAFTRYMVKFADPAWAEANGAEYVERMRQLFLRAHLDG